MNVFPRKGFRDVGPINGCGAWCRSQSVLSRPVVDVREENVRADVTAAAEPPGGESKKRTREFVIVFAHCSVRLSVKSPKTTTTGGNRLFRWNRIVFVLLLFRENCQNVFFFALVKPITVLRRPFVTVSRRKQKPEIYRDICIPGTPTRVD